MLWLGLAISALYVPGYTGASIQTSWVVLSLFLPALALWREVELTTLHWVLFAWVGLALASLAWTANFPDGVWGVWQVVLFALAFWLGSSLGSLRSLFMGLGIGASFSSLFAYAQALGYHWPMTNGDSNVAGLYFNSMYAGEIFALVVLGCVLYRLYWLVPIPALALAFTGSHAGWLALAAGLIAARFRHPILLLVLVSGAATFFTYHFRPSDVQRLQTWYAAYSHLVWFGNGPGSFLSVWWVKDGALLFPEYVHNDYLQLIYEYGILAIIPTIIILSPLLGKSSVEWPLYVAFAFMSLVSFPLYTPILAFIGACAAGRISRDWGLLRRRLSDRRLNVVLRSLNPQSEPSLVRGEALPLV